MRKLFSAAMAALALAVSVPANAAVTILTDSTGKLTGATGVNVNGSLYNVTLVEGTCAGLFSGCDAASDFTFQTSTAGLAAASALVNQVLGGFSTTGVFGCSNPSICIIAIPTTYNSDGSIAGNVAELFAGGSWEATNFSSGNNTGLNTSLADAWVYARFTYAGLAPAAVPEPATWALMLIGFGGIGMAMRRRKPSLQAA